MKVPEQERRDWIIIPLILGIGFLCVIIAGQWALHFSPSWKLNANMASNLDPNSDFLTRRPGGFIEPVDPSILTEPVWINLFLTPGASFITGTPFPKATITSSFTTSTIPQTPISIASATNVVIASPTNTFVSYPPTSSATSKPKPTATSTVSPIYTSTPAAAVTSSWTPTPTQSPTATATPSSGSTSTPTATDTPTATPTDTPTATATPSCSVTVIITGTSGSYAKPSGLTCFEYTDPTFANGGIFQITSTGVTGMVSGSMCPGKSIADGSTIDYGVTPSSGVMIFRIMGSAGTVDINISDWTAYPTCP